MGDQDEVPDLSGDVKLLSSRPVFVGPYSIVYRGKIKSNGELVAIKVLNPIHGAPLHTMRRKVERERRTWSVLRHPNILPLYGFADDDDEHFQPFGAFISPWLQRGDLAQYLRDHGALAPHEERLKLWKDVVAGVTYLHGHEPTLIHGDLKPRNILINDDGSASICDFGLVRVYLEGGNTGMTTTTPHTGTERYLAYELFMAEGDAIPTTASDIYATGCIGLEVIFLQTPYSNPGNNLRFYILKEMQAGNPPAVPPRNLTGNLAQLWSLLAWCWTPDPLSRPHGYILSSHLEDQPFQVQVTPARPEETAGIEATSSAPPMTNKNPRPLSHVSPSPGSHQIQGIMTPTMMSPSSPPLSPVNVQASMLFDYPLHPTFPRREHMPALILGFFEHFGSYMPFLQQGDITARANAGRLWNIHALAIAALASRFSHLSVHSSDLRGDHSNIYLSMAKPLITQYKGQMSLQALQGLIILSWAECGNLQEQSTSLPVLSALPGSPQFYISEAVRVARTLKLGFTAAINGFGVPREEILATWWSLMLIDELVAWNNGRPAMLEGRDFDHAFPNTVDPALDAFHQVSALSLQRRKVGRALFAPNASPGGINALIEGMGSAYADICKNRPHLDFGQVQLQNSLRRGQGSTYISLHILYHSTLVRARVRGITNIRYPLGSDKDPAILGARSIVDVIRWCNAENRSQAIIDNIFIETPLFEAGQALSLASEAMATAGFGSEFYLNEINEVHSTLSTLSRFWATASHKVASFSGVTQPYNYPSSSLSPSFSTMRTDSPHGQPMAYSFEYSSHANMPVPMASPSLYGWNRPAGSSAFRSPHPLASSPTSETYYDQEPYTGGNRHSRPSSFHAGQVQQNVYDQPWPYSH